MSASCPACTSPSVIAGTSLSRRRRRSRRSAAGRPLDTVAAVQVAVAAVEVALAAVVASAAEVAAGVPGRRRRPRPRAAPTTGRPAPSTCSFGTNRNWKI